jgi:hypothetical protein
VEAKVCFSEQIASFKENLGCEISSGLSAKDFNAGGFAGDYQQLFIFT